MPIDLTIAVTAHAEDFLLRPTLRSISQALDTVVAAGYFCELLIVLDRASDQTLREAARWCDDLTLTFPVRSLEVDNGESGASRNSAVAAARGRVLGLCDGDDLISQNFFESALEIIENSQIATVVHPETVVSFGDWALLWRVRSCDDAQLTYKDLLTANLWPSCSVALRNTFTRHPYPVLPPGSGFGPEDYAWNIATASAGVRHVTAPESVFFYRTRVSGGVNSAHAGSVLPSFDLDLLRTGFPRVDSPSANATKKLRRARVAPEERARRLVSRLRPTARKVTKRLPAWVTIPVRSLLVYAYGNWVQFRRTSTPPSTSLMLAFSRAAELEPALSWTAHGADRIARWSPPHDPYGAVLEGLLDALKSTEVLVLAPWVGIGGADLVTLNYATALAKAPGMRDKVSILTTYLPERTIRETIPDPVRHYQVDPVFRDWPLERQQRLVAQVVAVIRPRLIISVNCFDFTNALKSYARSITSASEVFLTLFAFDRIGDGNYPVNPITDDPHRAFLHHISGIITDNSVSAAAIGDILGIDSPFLRIHHQSAATPSYDFDEVVKQTAAYYDKEFSEERPFRVIWPHRLDKEKRPDALVRIVEEAKARGLPMEFHVYGQRVLENGNDDLTSRMKALGIINHGAYSGGLPALPTEDFHALLLTSESEGMPLVLAQSLLLGLPVVASAVGGVVDLIDDGVTGLLTSGPDDINTFVDKLRLLLDSRELRRDLIRRGYEKAALQHGLDSFTDRTVREFGFDSPV